MLKYESQLKRAKRLEYYKNYGKLYPKRSKATMDICEVKNPKINNYYKGDFTGTSDEVCSTFGCNKLLSMQEKLFGSKCIAHSQHTKQPIFNQYK